MGMFAHNVMEARMMQAYKLLDDSFNAYANRVPLSEFVNRVTSFQVPASIAPSGRPVTPSTLKNVCAICLVDFEENDRVLTLECNHVFHESCAKEWLFKSSFPSCPNCRKRVNDGVGEYLMASSNEERAELTLLVDCDYVRENFLGFEDDDDYEEEEDAQEEQELEEEEEEEDAYDLVQHEMRDMQHVSDLEAQQREEEEGGENRYL
jgi:ketosteroid isomerase-like protein